MKRTARPIVAVLLSTGLSFAPFGSFGSFGSLGWSGSSWSSSSWGYGSSSAFFPSSSLATSSETVDGRAGCCKDRE